MIADKLNRKVRHTPHIIMAVFAGTVLNGFIQILVEDYLGWPFYLDSVFTISVGIFFGWLPGVLTGLLTNLFIETLDGFQGLAWPFAIVNMATGLIAGLAAADKEKYLTIARQIGMILLITTVNTVLGAFIVNIVYGGYTGTRADILVSALVLVGRGKTLSSLLARIPTNLVDKGLPILLIYILYRVWRYRKESLENPEQFAE